MEVQARRRALDASADRERNTEEEEGGGRRAFLSVHPPLSRLQQLAHIFPQIESKYSQAGGGRNLLSLWPRRKNGSKCIQR